MHESELVLHAVQIAGYYEPGGPTGLSWPPAGGTKIFGCRQELELVNCPCSQLAYSSNLLF